MAVVDPLIELRDVNKYYGELHVLQDMQLPVVLVDVTQFDQRIDDGHAQPYSLSAVSWLPQPIEARSHIKNDTHFSVISRIYAVLTAMDSLLGHLRVELGE